MSTNQAHSVSCELGNKTLTIETGKLAKQAHGSVLVSYGETRVLVTACSASEPRAGLDFFPLTVEYSEKFYASGRIPGSFLRREGRPTSEGTVSARMIDRPIRPLFPDGYRNETQIVATVISLDPDADADSAAAIGTSAALHISDIPFNGPTAAVRIGRINGDFVVNPTWKQIKEKESDLNIFIAGTKGAIMMVEGGAQEVPEEDCLNAILKGHDEIKRVIGIIEELREKCGREKREFEPPTIPEDIVAAVKEKATPKLQEALQTQEKQTRYALIDEAKKAAVEALVPEDFKKSDPDEAAEKEKNVKNAFGDLKYTMMREMILSEGKRIDGRDSTTVRPIATEVGLLPRAHGSSLFTRGETQVMSVVTLGTGEDEQIVDNIYENTMRQVLFHYNFPPYSVGECGRMGGQSRREIGHGMLAERAVTALLPTHEDFPYTIRIVCETLESNGSSSMGSVCSASMALMHAGVPLPKPIAGIAMGLIKEGDRVAILSDILGDEDHLGDMDFKVAGTKDGVTSIQMDIKIEGVSEEIMKTALAQANQGRQHILGEMAKSIEAPQDDISPLAPKITSITVPVDKIGGVIGPSGKHIKAIIAETECKIDINDDGRINIASSDGKRAQMAIDKIQAMIAEAEEGKTYKGTVKRIVEFGAFVEILPNKEGLLHISEIAHEHVRTVDDFLKEGDELEVKCIEVDRMGKIRLSRRALLEDTRSPEEREKDQRRAGPPRGDRGGGGGRGGPRGDRGGRGGGGGRGFGGGGGRGGPRGGRGGGGGRGLRH